MAFWWASQGANYPTAIRQGSLWTCLRINGVLPPDRALLKELGRGDVVFHHYRQYLRAVSVVTAPWRDETRPEGYPTAYGDALNDGWLVTVEPLATDLDIHFMRVAELLPHGSPGPLDKNGRPHQKYLSALPVDQGLRLLSEAGLTHELGEDSGNGDAPVSTPASSDAHVMDARRLEQAALRAYLFGGRSDGSCGLCGRVLPAKFLVAGHIKPRSQCTNIERWDFRSVAMLVCTLGCDTLFEHGYVTVDENGDIAGGITPSHPALSAVVDALTGQACSAYNDARAEAFRAHRTACLAEQI